MNENNEIESKVDRGSWIVGGVIMGTPALVCTVLLSIYQYSLPEGEYIDAFTLWISLPTIGVLTAMSIDSFRRAFKVGK